MGTGIMLGCGSVKAPLWSTVLILLQLSYVRGDLYDPPPFVCPGGVQAQRPPSGTPVIDQPLNDYSGGVPSQWKHNGGGSFQISADKTYVAAPINGQFDGFSFPLDSRFIAGAEYSIQAWVRLQGAASSRLNFLMQFDNTYDCAGAVTVASNQCWTLVTGGYTQPVDFATAKLALIGAPVGSQILLRSIAFVLVNRPNLISPDIAARTDALRRRTVYLKVVDTRGSPLAGASVSVDQVENSFPFGASIQRQIVNNGAYQQFIKNGFNHVVFQNEMKWYAVEPQQGVFDYAAADAMLAFAEANKLKVRGHNIFWEDETFAQPWVKALSAPALRTAMDRHLQQIVTRYKGRVVHWDVDNESLHFRYLINKAGTSVDGRPIEPWMYAKTKELDPGAKTALNEYNIIETCGDPVAFVEAYINKAKSVTSAGGVVEILGIQGQFLGAQPQQIRYNLDRLALFGTPVWLTEINVNVGDDAKHALYLEKILREAFAHPAVYGILLWNVWEPAENRPNPRVLTNLDFSLNAAGQRYMSLRREWSTRGVAGTTDAGGNFPGFRAYFGTYTAKVTLNGQTVTVPFTVSESTDNAFVTLVADVAGGAAPTQTSPPGYLLPDGQCDYTRGYTTCLDATGATAYCCSAAQGCSPNLARDCPPRIPPSNPGPAPTTPAGTPGGTPAPPTPTPTTPRPTTPPPSGGGSTPSPLLPDGQCDYTRGYTTCYENGSRFCCMQGCPYPLGSNQGCVRVPNRRRKLLEE